MENFKYKGMTFSKVLKKENFLLSVKSLKREERKCYRK